MLLGDGVSDESVWVGEVKRTKAVKLGGATVEVSGALSVLPLPSVTRALDVSWLPAGYEGLGGRSRVRTYRASRRVKFFPAAGTHSSDQHS